MKVIYLGNFENKFSDTTEKHIKYALEQLGHKVVTIDETNTSLDEILTFTGDLFLFHKGIELIDLVELLNKITYKKVFWYFDKVWNDREQWMNTVIPFVDKGFLTDEAWIRSHNYKNIEVLRQGIGNEDTSLGTFKKEYESDIAFLGTVYGERKGFIKALQEVYKDRFRIYNNVFGRDLYDLCASAKIIVAPKFPQNDFYWSSRIYMTLGSGGFLIHPRLEGLKEEFEEDKHFVAFSSGKELKDKIDYYLAHKKERKKIQMAGYKHCLENYTYQDRVKKLLETIK